MSDFRLHLVLGDQLSDRIAAVRTARRGRDLILLAEVGAELSYVPHNRKKTVLILSAMRHFAAALRQAGHRVAYVELGEEVPSFTEAVRLTVASDRPAGIVCTWPGEWRVLEELRGLEQATGLPVKLLEDDRFIARIEDFAAWAEGRKALRMEYFYREMRRRTGILMDGDQPVGGRWNLDAENRKPLPPGLEPPLPPPFPPDALTQAVIDQVERANPPGCGGVEGFSFPVTRDQALLLLDHFITHALKLFGDHQDALATGQPLLFHSLLSPALNMGLLDPLEVCRAAEAAHHRGEVPLNAAEGFIRQILGWREYVRGLYWTRMPDYAETNFLNARRDLPWFFWDGETDMACLRACIGQTLDLAYAHHIQRLMVIGNFATLAGLDPKAVNAWYLAVYADAFEWVQLPNTHGMALYADGGVMGSKPYVASGKYIERMSDYCRSCRYDVKKTEGEGACPFNALYWAFLARHRERLADNPRLAMPYRTLDRMGRAREAAMLAEAERFLSSLGNDQPRTRTSSAGGSA